MLAAGIVTREKITRNDSGNAAVLIAASAVGIATYAAVPTALNVYCAATQKGRHEGY